MNPAPRVLIVARRYWPSCSDSTQRLLHWVSALRNSGVQLTVLTAKWHSSWSSRIDVQEIPVYRVEMAPTNPLRNARYCRAIQDWIHQHANRFDLIYCDAADLEAQVVTNAAASSHRLPVVIRYCPIELTNGWDLRWQPGARTLDACRKATAIVVPRADALQHVKSIGIDDRKIYRVVDNTSAVARTDVQRAASRNALAEVNHDLYVRGSDRVVVCLCEFHRRAGLDSLVRVMGPLVQEQRSLRFWMLGDSPDRSRIYEQLRYNGWHNLISMPGAFEDMEDVLRVADLVVVPSRGSSLGWLIPKCIASGIGLLAAESPELRSFVPPEAEKTICFREGNTDQLRGRIESWLGDSQPLRHAMGLARDYTVSARPGASWDWILSKFATTYSS